MTDDKKYIFQSSFNNSSNYTPRYKMFASNEEMLGNLIISIYDTPPQIKPPQKHSVETFNNGIIDVDEFNDTKEEYEKKIEKIKKYCQKYDQDISEIKLPTYEDMCILCGRNVDLETMTSFLRPKKSINEEIGLKNLKYKTIEKEDNEQTRKYEDGSIVQIKTYGNLPKEIIIKKERLHIIKKFNSAGAKITEQEINEATYINKITDYYPTSGKIKTIRIRDQYSAKLIETIDYDKNGNRILNDNQKLAHELVKDLTNRNFIGLKSVRNSLQENLNKITPDNIEEVLREYKRTVGKSLAQGIEEMRVSIDSLYEIFSMKSYTTTDKIKDKIAEMLVKIYPQSRNISDMQDFLENTGIGDEFYAMLDDKNFTYSDFKYNWKELTGRDSFEADFLNSNLPPEIKAQYNKVIWHEACQRLNIKSNLKIENSQIKNDNYTSNMIYDIQYNLTTDWIGGTITIINKTTGVTRIIDVNKITKNMSEIDYCTFLSNLQTLPGEILEDIAVECNNVIGHSGKESYLIKKDCGGEYLFDDETILAHTAIMRDFVHELGHAIDHTYKYGRNYAFSDELINTQYAKTLQQEYDKYILKGGKEFGKDTTEPSVYCTSSSAEMFAECYTLLMTGNCHSKDTILKHFRKTLIEAEKLLQEIRKLPDDVRLRK